MGRDSSERRVKRGGGGGRTWGREEGPKGGRSSSGDLCRYLSDWFPRASANERHRSDPTDPTVTGTAEPRVRTRKTENQERGSQVPLHFSPSFLVFQRLKSLCPLPPARDLDTSQKRFSGFAVIFLPTILFDRLLCCGEPTPPHLFHVLGLPPTVVVVPTCDSPMSPVNLLGLALNFMPVTGLRPAS